VLTHPFHPECVLVEQCDLDAGLDHPLLDGVLDTLRTVSTWARTYLCRPHPDLGRRGPVCPYAQASLDRGMFFLAVQRGVPASTDALDETLLIYRDWFRQLPPTGGPAAQFKTILLVLPDVPPESVREIVDATQRRLKPRYVSEGLMIGEFHSGPPDKGGLWNPDFRPLRSPVPMLVIRHMVASDFPFLADDAGLVADYLRFFGPVTPLALRDRVAEAAHRFGLQLPEWTTPPAARGTPSTHPVSEEAK